MSDKNQAVPVPADELAQLRADATRYQYVRKGDLYRGPRAIAFVFDAGRWISCCGNDLDAAIDAAMKEQQ